MSSHASIFCVFLGHFGHLFIHGLEFMEEVFGVRRDYGVRKVQHMEVIYQNSPTDKTNKNQPKLATDKTN